MPISVQIVEDHVLFAEALGSVIRDLPEYDLVGISATGPEAISTAREKQPAVILLDYHLPGYNAEELIPLLKGVAPESRVIILTSDTSDASLVRSVQAGIDGYLTKDKALDDIVSALGQVAKHQSLLTEEQLAKVRRASEPAQGEALTAREIQILKLLALGRDTAAIAEELTIGGSDVRTHVRNIFPKLGASSTVEAIAIAKSKRLLRSVKSR